ncbi:pyrroline-5-carboxylate reductase [Syntrophotalea acetylenica]|nr:pyrroline-5-carboxylate reductase [Syntrophotalea acetylenica]
MMELGNIGFIGGGNMGEALIKGLIKSAIPARNIRVAEPNEARARQLTERYGVICGSDGVEVVRQSDLVVLAIKPQIVPVALPAIAGAFDDSKLLVSIAAGVTTAALEVYFQGAPRVVRVMPNTPALAGAGAAALCSGAHAGKEDLSIALHLFEGVGTVHVVSESQLDAVTGLSGSGPAYVYMVIEAMAAGGVLEGLPMDTALALATQTVLGAAQLVKESGEHPAVLRDQVCSPGGTTIAAVKELEEKGLRAALIKAVSKAAKRSRELGRN